MLNDDVYAIMRFGQNVGMVRESVIISGMQYYSIFLTMRYVKDDPLLEGEYFLCDTINPQHHLDLSSFNDLVLADITKPDDVRWISSPFVDNWTDTEEDN